MLLLKHFSNGYFIHRGAELAEELECLNAEARELEDSIALNLAKLLGN